MKFKTRLLNIVVMFGILMPEPLYKHVNILHKPSCLAVLRQQHLNMSDLSLKGLNFNFITLLGFVPVFG